MAQRDAADAAASDQPRGVGNIPGNAEFLGQDIGGSGREQRHGHLAAGEAVDHLIDRAVSAAGDHHASALFHRQSRDGLRQRGAGGGRELRGDACILQ